MSWPAQVKGEAVRLSLARLPSVPNNMNMSLSTKALLYLRTDPQRADLSRSLPRALALPRRRPATALRPLCAYTRIIPGMGHRHIFDIKCPKNVHQILISMSHYCPIY